MKRTTIILSAIAILFARGQVVGQEAAEEPNIHFEKLKVLQPLLGTWHTERINPNDGNKRERSTTVRWFTSKKMIEEEIKIRVAGPNSKEQEWSTWVPHYYVWNADANHIEYYVINPANGIAIIWKVDVGEDGLITYLPIKATHKAANTWKRIDKVTEKTWATKFHDGKDADGNAVDDFEFTREKVK